MSERYIVYILQSVSHPDKTYVGYTTDLKRRFSEHNECTQTYTKRYAPWEILSYTVFMNQQSALAFEKYLKTSSGKAFIAKRILFSDDS